MFPFFFVLHSVCQKFLGRHHLLLAPARYIYMRMWVVFLWGFEGDLFTLL
jgi:hypothetical protein